MGTAIEAAREVSSFEEDTVRWIFLVTAAGYGNSEPFHLLVSETCSNAFYEFSLMI
ncbi:hypothetical protein FOA52_007411 [Chlamydomonas sp. UWO 241]|nr:hypothetical protein FOA52_007411 [Chlamydomonas sp. UWO 241]